MATVTREIKMRMTAQDVNVSTVLDRTQARLKGFAQTLKGGFGSSSGLGELTNILRGGGQAIGLTLALRSMSSMAERAVEFRNALRDGTRSAGELADQLARSIPILGEAWSLGRSLRELFTGEGAEDDANARRIEARTRAFTLDTTRRLSQISSVRGLEGEVDSQELALKRAKELAEAPDDFGRERISARHDFEASRTAIEKRRAEVIKAERAVPNLWWDRDRNIARINQGMDNLLQLARERQGLENERIDRAAAQAAAEAASRTAESRRGEYREAGPIAVEARRVIPLNLPQDQAVESRFGSGIAALLRGVQISGGGGNEVKQEIRQLREQNDRLMRELIQTVRDNGEFAQRLAEARLANVVGLR